MTKICLFGEFKRQIIYNKRVTWRVLREARWKWVEIRGIDDISVYVVHMICGNSVCYAVLFSDLKILKYLKTEFLSREDNRRIKSNKKLLNLLFCVISCCRRGIDEIINLLGCYAAYTVSYWRFGTPLEYWTDRLSETSVNSTNLCCVTSQKSEDIDYSVNGLHPWSSVQKSIKISVLKRKCGGTCSTESDRNNRSRWIKGGLLTITINALTFRRFHRIN